jgi:hypothetical protein
MSEQQQQQTSNDVEQAERIVANLETKRRELVEGRAADAEQRRAVAFAAHTGGGDKAAQAARATLDKLAAAAVRFDAELRSVEDAIAEAQVRLHAARAAEAREADRVRALELKKLIGELIENGGVVDDALADLITAGNNLKACFDRLAGHGVSHPRHEQLAVMGNLSILTALGQTPWRRYFQTLAPREKKNFAAVMTSWCEGLSTDVERRLGEVKEVEHAA